MTTTRTLTALAVLPLLTVTGQGLAGASGQPGLAVPGDGQPGLSTTPAPPAAPPSLADYLPDPPAPPARPRPQQQLGPQADTLIQQPPATEPDEPQSAAPSPEVTMDPHVLRAGDTTVPVPDWVDAKTRNKVQAYLDYMEWEIAAGYDNLGFSRDESDRRAASTLTGGVVAGAVGAELVSVPAAFVGCGIGAIVGGLAGGAIGATAAGVGLPFGAAAGAGLGCLAASAIAAVPAIGVGAAVGAILGGASAGALGSGVDIPKPAEPPPVIEISAPAPATQTPTADAVPFGQQLADDVDAFTAAVPAVEPIVTSLRSAIAALPPLIPTW
ncbi:hypothetical protein [Nocardia sp. NPDC046763]|uniref:hypothetical protein n=1 Tax=Nocardia sp. NPDC046763 TaxID=3155256 RepID=UPI0033C08D14